MGRKKIAIKKINDCRRRQVTFVRRKFGLMKKAYELAVLCQCDVALMMVTSDSKMFLYSNKPMDNMISTYNEAVLTPEDCEIVNDDEMVRMIERGKDGLDEYFGGPGDDDDEEEEEKEVKPARKRSSVGSSSTSKRSKPENVYKGGAMVTAGSDGLPQVMPSTYYFPPPPTGYPGMNMMAYHHPYFLYPHPGVSTGQSVDEENKTQMSSSQNSALHLPPLPFAYAQQLQHEASGSNQSLTTTQEGQLPPSGNSAMFAGGMYYPFGTPWATMALANGSSSDMRQTSSTSDLIAAAEAAANEVSTAEGSAERAEHAESVKYKEGTLQEEAAKSMGDKLKETEPILETVADAAPETSVSN